MSGDTVFLGGRAFNSPDGLEQVGAAYVCEQQGTGFSELVRETAALDNEDVLNAAPEVGTAVAIDGDTILLGAEYAGLGAFRSGGGYVFTRSLGSLWEQQGWLTVDDPAMSRRLGESADVDVDTAHEWLTDRDLTGGLAT